MPRDITVTFDDGTNHVYQNAPDNVTPEQVSERAQNEFGKGIVSLDGGRKPQSTSSPLSDSSLQNGLAGAGKAFHDLGIGGLQLVNSGMGKATGDPIYSKMNDKLKSEVDEERLRDAPLMASKAGFAGNVVGNVAATAPLAMIPGANTYLGAAAIGGGLGAAQERGTSDSLGKNAALSAVLAPATQALGAGVIKSLRGAAPATDSVRSQVADLAAKYGINLDAAQVTGSKPLQTINAVMEHLPFTAGSESAKKEAQRQAFNAAVLKSAGIDSSLATDEALNGAKQRIGGEFNRLTNNNNVKLDDNFLNKLTEIDANANPFSAGSIKGAVDSGQELAANAENNAGAISGKDYQNIRSSLGRQAKSAFVSGDSEKGQALKQIQSALDDSARSSIPQEDQASWDTARKQYQALKIIEQAAKPNNAEAVQGNVSAAKLASALLKHDPNFIRGTGNQQELADLAKIGQLFVKDQVPNSGTAQRAGYQALLTGGVSPLAIVNPVAGAGAAATSLVLPKLVQKGLNTKAVQAYLKNGVPVAGKALNNLSKDEAKKLANALSRSGITATNPLADEFKRASGDQ